MPEVRRLRLDDMLTAAEASPRVPTCLLCIHFKVSSSGSLLRCLGKFHSYTTATCLSARRSARQDFEYDCLEHAGNCRYYEVDE